MSDKNVSQQKFSDALIESLVRASLLVLLSGCATSANDSGEKKIRSCS